MLSAVGNAVHAVQKAAADVTGIGKGDKDSPEDQDTQQQTDQAPAGEDEASPEFTTTSKDTQPSGEETVTTTKDDVPLPADDTPAADSTTSDLQETPEADAEPTADIIPEPESSPAAPSTPDADTAPTATTATTESASSPAAAEPAEAGPVMMNQLRNMGGGSKPLPSTPKEWKKNRNSWHPDAAGVLYAPGFFINKRRHPAY